MAHNYEFQKRRMAQEAKEKGIRNAKRLALILAGCLIGIYFGGGFNARIYLEGDIFGMLAAGIAGVAGSAAFVILSGYDS